MIAFRLFEDIFAVDPTQWQDWGEWSECTATCGEGLNIRARACFDPESEGNRHCPGSPTQVKKCEEAECTLTGNVVQKCSHCSRHLFLSTSEGSTPKQWLQIHILLCNFQCFPCCLPARLNPPKLFTNYFRLQIL